MDFWDDKFHELAVFNAAKDNRIYHPAYIAQMEALQKEYNKRLSEHADRMGIIQIRQPIW